jgi:hypothetical protein
MDATKNYERILGYLISKQIGEGSTLHEINKNIETLKSLYIKNFDFFNDAFSISLNFDLIDKKFNSLSDFFDSKIFANLIVSIFKNQLETMDLSDPNELEIVRLLKLDSLESFSFKYYLESSKESVEIYSRSAVASR